MAYLKVWWLLILLRCINMYIYLYMYMCHRCLPSVLITARTGSTRHSSAPWGVTYPPMQSCWRACWWSCRVGLPSNTLIPSHCRLYWQKPLVTNRWMIWPERSIYSTCSSTSIACVFCVFCVLRSISRFTPQFTASLLYYSTGIS